MKQLYTMAILLLIGNGTVVYSQDNVIQPFGKITWEDSKLDVLKKICEIESVKQITISNLSNAVDNELELDRDTLCSDINISVFDKFYDVDKSINIQGRNYARSYHFSISAFPIVINHLDFAIRFLFQTDQDYMATQYMQKTPPIVISSYKSNPIHESQSNAEIESETDEDIESNSKNNVSSSNEVTTEPENNDTYFAYEYLSIVSLHSEGMHDNETYKAHLPTVKKTLVNKYKHLTPVDDTWFGYHWKSSYNDLSVDFTNYSINIHYHNKGCYPVGNLGHEGQYSKLLKKLDGADKGLLNSL